jgi:hypothetical protein
MTEAPRAAVEEETAPVIATNHTTEDSGPGLSIGNAEQGDAAGGTTAAEQGHDEQQLPQEAENESMMAVQTNPSPSSSSSALSLSPPPSASSSSGLSESPSHSSLDASTAPSADHTTTTTAAETVMQEASSNTPLGEGNAVSTDSAANPAEPQPTATMADGAEGSDSADAATTSNKPPRGSEVFVGGLGKDVNEADLYSAFANVGEIFEVRAGCHSAGSGLWSVSANERVRHHRRSG